MNSRTPQALLAMALGLSFGFGMLPRLPRPKKQREPNEFDALAMEKAAEKRARKTMKRTRGRAA